MRHTPISLEGDRMREDFFRLILVYFRVFWSCCGLLRCYRFGGIFNFVPVFRGFDELRCFLVIFKMFRSYLRLLWSSSLPV